MAGIVGVFASIGEHIPIFRNSKKWEPSTEGEINKLHYRGTCIIILVMCLMVTTTEWIAGTDAIIECLHQGSIPQNVINSYCYIMGTFSIPRHYVDKTSEVGRHVVAPGVGPFDGNKDYVSIKAYYQWVPFMLFLQGIMFYVPHLIFKSFEEGKIKAILDGLNTWILIDDERTSKEEELSKYLVTTRGHHTFWASKLILVHFLYLVNVIGQMFFTDCFLGYEFTSYGIQAASFLEANQEDRIDPMSRVFPRMTKCTFRKYGPTGTIQKHDAQCILPINIINEKIYVFLWFWFLFLAVVTSLDILWNLFVILSPRARYLILKRKIDLCPQRKTLEIDIEAICDNINFGDWKLMYHLLRNMDAVVFGEFAKHLTLAVKKSQKCPDDDCILLKSILID